MRWNRSKFVRPHPSARRSAFRTIYRPVLDQLEPRLAPSVDVLSWRGSLAGNNSGANLKETQLTPANVNPNTFGLRFTYPVDGQVYGEPLVKTNVAIPGNGTHDVVFVATEHDSVYAFDANSNFGTNAAPLWHDSFINPTAGITTVPSSVTQSGDITPEIGITATPTIDPTSGTLYVVSKTAEVRSGVTHYVQKLHALDIGSGAEKFGGPVLLGDTTFGGPDGGFTDTTPITVPGTGDSSDGATVHFNALRENERDGLVLSGSVLYLTFTSHGDTTPYHGWLVGFNPTTLQVVSVYNVTPNGTEGAIWMGGGAPAVDANGNIYFATGNGTFDATSGGAFALGGGGGNLGVQGIGNSFAVTFRAYASSSTGLWQNGQFLTPNSLSGTGIDFNGGAQGSTPHIYSATLSYSGTTLTETIKDLTANSATVTETYTNVNIAQLVGGNTAFVGFTGGTGGLNMQQEVQTWTFSNGTTTIDHSGGFASNSDVQANGSAGFTNGAALLTPATNGQAGTIFTKAPVNVTGFSTTFTFQMAAGTNPVADGMTFTIENSPPGQDYGMSVEKVSPTPGSNGQLPVLTFFAPHDEASLSGVDLDQGSGGVLLLPDSAGSAAHPHLLVQTGKTGRIYLLDRDNLGGFSPTDSGAVQVLPDGTVGGIGSYDTPAYFNNGSQQFIYYAGANDVLRSFTITNGQLSSQPFAVTTTNLGFPGANPMISANDTSNGIIWVLDDHLNGTEGHPNSGPAVLHAYDATTLKELYNSSQLGLLDQLGNAVKFTVPTVANGKVYVGTQTGLYVFGLFPTPTAVPAAPVDLGATATSSSSITLTWTNEATNARGIKILRSVGSAGNFVQVAEVNHNATTYTDTKLLASTKYFYEVVATNALGDSNASNTANARTPIGPAVLHITGTGSTEIDLAWTPTADGHYNVLRSTNGTTFSVIANVSANVTSFEDTGLSPGTYFYEVQGFDQDSETATSNTASATVGKPVSIKHATDFSNTSDLTANGSAFFGNISSSSGGLNAIGAVLTDGFSFGQAGTIFSNQKVDIRGFTTTFTFQPVFELTIPVADGLAFIIQSNSPTALGGAGGGVGYQGINHSVAVTYRAFAPSLPNSDSSTELGENGQFVTSTDITAATASAPGGPINFQATADTLPPNDVYSATLSYNGTTLTETITDLNTGTTFSTSYTVNLQAFVGGDTAFVGFGGGDGGLTLTNEVFTWTYTPTTQNQAPLAPNNLKVADVVRHDDNRSDVILTWTRNSFNETGYEVDRSTDGVYFTPLATLPPNSDTYTDSTVDPGTYSYRVFAFNAAGNSLFSNVDAVIVGTPGQPVTVDHSAGFTSHSDLTANGSATFYPNSDPVGAFAGHMDIGSQGDPSPAGSATFNASTGAYTLTASGSDIWTNTDHMQYVYERLVGDGSIVARLVSASAPDFWTKAGLMIRDDVTSGAANDFMLDTPNPFHQEPVMQFRDTDGGQTADTGNHFTSTTPNVPTPIWLKLVRSGNTFTGYWAVDMNGTPGPWQLLMNDPHITVMPATVYIGLALTAHSNGNVATATFDHVMVTGTTTALPPAVARLTDGGGTEAGSVFETPRVGVTNFTTTFTFRMHDGTNPMADGMAFVIQGNSPSALGFPGGGLGYGPDTPGGPQGIPNSIAIKFDLFSNAGEGIDSTGLFLNGDSPTIAVNPGDTLVDLTNTGIDLHSQDVFQVTLAYDGITLTETIKDTNTGATFTTSYTVDIAAQVGGNVGYVGFTGGTGGLTTVADVQTWTYQFTSPVSAPNSNGTPQGLGASPVAPGEDSGATSAPETAGDPTGIPTLVPPLGLNPIGALGTNAPVLEQEPTSPVLPIDSGFQSPSLIDGVTADGQSKGLTEVGHRPIGGGAAPNALAAANLDEVFGAGDLTGPF
jgi:hypothetical protein